MEKRIITQEQRRWLLRELSEWQRSGLLPAETATQILDIYVPPDVVAAEKKAKGVEALMGIAALLAGVAVLLLIGFNWEYFPSTAKLATLFTILAGIYTGGWYLRYRKGERLLSDIVLFLGCLLYGASIWLIQQVFQVSISPTVGLFWWAVGVVPFVLFLDTLLFHSLLVGLLSLWGLFSDNIFDWWDNPTIAWQDWLPSCLVLLPAALFGLYRAHRQNRPALINLYLPLLFWWAMLPLWRYNSWLWLPALGLLGTISLNMSGQSALTEALRSPYRRYGVLAVGMVLLPLGYYRVLTESLTDVGQAMALPGVVTVLALIAIGMLFLFSQRRNRAAATLPERTLSAFLAALFTAQILLCFWHPKEPTVLALLLSLLSNAASVALGVYLVQRGIQEERGRTFGLGVCYLLLWMCVRYMDLFGDVGGMLGASLLFGLCAAVLFGVALYWRKRKGNDHV